MMNNFVTAVDFDVWLPHFSRPSERIQHVFAQFFFAEIANPHTRRAYMCGTCDFFRFVTSELNLPSLDRLSALHVTAWLNSLKSRGLSIPTIKQRLAGLRMLCQALVREQVMPSDPTAVVRAPKYSVTTGRTPTLDGSEIERLFSSIDHSTLNGLRDRALIGTMAYSFARISAVCGLKMRDIFRQERRLWLRLCEKGGKHKDVPCHSRLQDFLADWIECAEMKERAPEAPLFPTLSWTHQLEATTEPRARSLSHRPMTQAMAWEMLKRRASAAGIDTPLCNHSFRAAGITAYLSNGGTIERAAAIAGHASTRTTQLYDRRPDHISLTEIDRIFFE